MKREPKVVSVAPKIVPPLPTNISQPMPSLVTLAEFILTLSKQRTNYHESLGGFVYWIKKEGCPKRWPFKMWKEKFDKFLSRKT